MFQVNIGSETLKADTTVNLLVADSTAEKQAKIDAVPKNALGAVTATFQFADGTHTETDTLTFDGFTYPIVIQGNTSDNTKSTTKTVGITFGAGQRLSVENCSKLVTVAYLKITCSTLDNSYGCINIYNCPISHTDACYTILDSNSGAGVRLWHGTHTVSLCYVSYGRAGILGLKAIIHASDNSQTGTQPDYGLRAFAGCAIGKETGNPTGSVANENTASGGVIR